MKAHITGFFYFLEKKALPFLKLINENDEEKFIPLNKNKKITITKDYGKKCTGYFKEGKHFNCPNNSMIDYGKKCRLCQLKDEFLVCAKCNGSDCLAEGEIKNNCLNNTHFLYITLIGDTVKVGMTKAGRYLRRWIEQGSDYSCIIDSGDGRTIRQKEHELSKDIVDRVKTSLKIKKFMIDDKTILEKFLEEKGLTPQIINVRKYYDGINHIPRKPCFYEGLIDGRIVCVKGKVIIFEKNDNYFYYDVNDLLAHVVDIEI